MFSWICAWREGKVNNRDNRDASDFRRYRYHYEVTVITQTISFCNFSRALLYYNTHGVISSGHIFCRRGSLYLEFPDQIMTLVCSFPAKAITVHVMFILPGFMTLHLFATTCNIACLCLEKRMPTWDNPGLQKNICRQGLLLLTSINVNPSMDK